MKKFKALVITASLITTLLAAGCGNTASVSTSTSAETKTSTAASTETTTETKTYKVGICNFVDDASLNQIVKNIEDELKEVEGKENVKFEINYDNCNADANVMAQIISNFEADNVDLMVGVATPVAIQMQNATEGKNIPVVFAAVSDPLGAGLVESLEKPGANITGTSDYLNTEAVLNILLAFNPDTKKVGLLYDAGQDASTKPIEEAKAFFTGKGIDVVTYTATSVDEAMLAADSLIADKVDAVFTPTDNTIMTAELSIYEKFAAAKIPHFCGADSFALNGAFLGFGVDYAALGRETGAMVADILLNGKNVAEVGVKTFDNGAATVNTDTCAALEVTFDDVKSKIEQYCTVVNPITTAESFD